MLLYFDPDTLDLRVRCGALEEYSVTPEIKELVRRAQALKEKKDEFLKTEYDPEIKQLLDIVDRINTTANPELKALQDRKKKEK